MAKPYEAQKARFSSVQSNHHKLLNTLKTEKFNTLQLLQLVKINETLDILEAQIIDFNENNCDINESEMDIIKKKKSKKLQGKFPIVVRIFCL